MFDFSWSEILLIGIVALVVIGPKDLPRVLRTAGQWMGRARAVAREFQSQVDQLVRESELADVRKHMTEAASLDSNQMIGKWIDPSGELAKSVSTPELLGEAHPVTPAEPDPEPELPLLAPAPPPREPAATADEHAEPAVPVEIKSGTHG